MPATPEPEPEIAASARERMFRVEIIQDAFCARRPKPQRLFRKPSGHRDLYSWCDLEASRYPTSRHRCAHGTDASDLYRRANQGDWQAECRLHRLATRASMRQLAERVTNAFRAALDRHAANRRLAMTVTTMRPDSANRRPKPHAHAHPHPHPHPSPYPSPTPSWPALCRPSTTSLTLQTKANRG